MSIKKTASPLYEKIFNTIKKNIDTNVWSTGDKIPSERELCELYGVSRITVRRAIELSEQAGLIRRVGGSGTYVTDRKYDQTLNKVVSFEKTLAALGVTGTTRICRVESRPADLLMHSILGAEINEAILNLQLIGYASDKPIVLYDSYLMESIGKEVLALAQQAEQKQRAFSTVELQHKRLLEQPLRIKQTFEAIAAHTALAESLLVPKGHPILKITSIIYFNEQAIEYRLAYYLGDKYKFSTERTVYSSLA